MTHSNVSLVTMVVVGLVAFAIGVVWTRLRAASGAIRSTKAGLKGLQALFWSVLWLFVKVGALGLIVVIVIVWWNVRDAGDDGDTPLVPANLRPSVTSSGTPSPPAR